MVTGCYKGAFPGVRVAAVLVGGYCVVNGVIKLITGVYMLACIFGERRVCCAVLCWLCTLGATLRGCGLCGQGTKKICVAHSYAILLVYVTLLRCTSRRRKLLDRHTRCRLPLTFFLIFVDGH